MAGSHFTRIVAVLFLVVSFQANADVFVNVGTYIWQKPGEQLWWQRGHENEFRNESLLIEPGIESDSIELGGIKLRLKAKVFGVTPYKLDAWAVADEGCNGMWGGAPGCGSPDRYITRGYIYGIGGDLEASYGGYFVSFGLDRYKQHFSLRVEHPYTTGVVDDLEFSEYGSAWSFGVGYRFKGFDLAGKVRHGDAGGKMAGGQFPAGTDDGFMVYLSVRK